MSNEPKIINKIKERGYWRFLFQPLSHKERISRPTLCKEMVEKNRLQITGWDYPHTAQLNNDVNGYGPGNDYFESWSEFEEYKEFWRLYQSGQFIHYRSVMEDWLVERKVKNMWLTDKEESVERTFIGVSRTIYLITQVIEFLNRLSKEGLYDDGVEINIELHNTEGRYLRVDNHNRVPFMSPKQTRGNVLTYKHTFSKDEINDNTKKIALDVINHFFDRFNWTEIPQSVIEVDVDNLLNGKL